MAVYAPNSYLLYRDLPLRDQPGGPSNAGACSPAPVSGGGFFATASGRGRRSWRRGEVRAVPFWQDISRPTSIAMEPIESEEQLDQVLRRSQEEKHLVLIDWMAAWCRKCIYLKPKLEKLAAEYHPSTGINNPNIRGDYTYRGLKFILWM